MRKLSRQDFETAIGAVALVAAGWAEAWADAAAGVSPAKARAIAHPISLIFTPVACIGAGSTTAPP